MKFEEIEQKLASKTPEERKKILDLALKATKDLIWVPNPGPQKMAFDSPADELFYGGQAGGGKTDLVLGLATTRHKRSLIFREFNEDARKLGERLLELIENGYGSTDGWNQQFLTYKKHKKIIQLAGIPNEKDKQRHKGSPNDFLAFDEIGDFYESQYTFIIGWNRSADKNQRCRVVVTGNPPTRAKGLWVIKRWGAWLDPRHPKYPTPDGVLRWYTTIDGKEVEVDGPGPHEIGGEMVRARSRTFIRARLADNPDLARTEYDATLAALPERERRAYREGIFDDLIQDDLNQLIPTEWIMAAQMGTEKRKGWPTSVSDDDNCRRRGAGRR